MCDLFKVNNKDMSDVTSRYFRKKLHCRCLTGFSVRPWCIYVRCVQILSLF